MESSKVRIVEANDRPGDVIMLMQKYVDWLMVNDYAMKQVLESQHLEDEVEDLNTKYAPPEGRLYIAEIDGRVAGCIGLTRLSDEICEAKRLYVLPEFRGNKIGETLMEKIITDARTIGYKYVRLDSFPFMTSAVKLYDLFGFYPIENYNGNPSSNAIFRELDLTIQP